MLDVGIHAQKAVRLMNSHFPNHETICAALSLAIRAPSVHNTQPWSWRVGPDSLHLYADRGLQLAATDPDGRDLIVSCGIALHHCVAALAALGWQTKVHRHPDLDDPETLPPLRCTPNRLVTSTSRWVPRSRAGAPIGAPTARGMYQPVTSPRWVRARRAPG